MEVKWTLCDSPSLDSHVFRGQVDDKAILESSVLSDFGLFRIVEINQIIGHVQQQCCRTTIHEEGNSPKKRKKETRLFCEIEFLSKTFSVDGNPLFPFAITIVA